MDHYLLHLSYTSAGWQSIIDRAETFDQRLDPVRKLIAHLGGSLATFTFFDAPHTPEDARKHKHIVYDKFAMFGEHDLVGVLAMPDRHAAQALTIAISSQPSVAKFELTAMMPFEHAIANSVGAAKAAVAATHYAAPGPAPAPSPPPAPR